MMPLRIKSTGVAFFYLLFSTYERFSAAAGNYGPPAPFEGHIICIDQTLPMFNITVNQP
jgi:hypothetical protein